MTLECIIQNASTDQRKFFMKKNKQITLNALPRCKIFSASKLSTLNKCHKQFDKTTLQTDIT